MERLEDLIVGTVHKSKLDSAEYIALATVDGELCIDFISTDEELLKFSKSAHKSTLYLQVEEDRD